MLRHLAVTIALSLLSVTGLLFSQDPPTDTDGGIFDQRLVANDQPTPTEEGVQPQAKGPVHEAFANPAVSVPQPGPIVDKQVPQPIEEMPPEQKPDGDNVQWISGYWHFDPDASDFMWISGIWRQIPPGMEWVPGTWNVVMGGSQYSPGFWRQEELDNGDMAIVPTPPEPLVTADPPPPDNNSTYVPGSWVYRETRYVWRPACWVPYRPGWVWVPARYVACGCGYIFVEGYWDYTLQDRGLLFAPIVVSRTVYSRPGWIYRPSYVVHDRCLMTCLFVNSRFGCYTFGDYYDPRYLNQGYVAWSSYRVNRIHPEPLFTHYRHANRNNPSWERDLIALQQARLRNEVPRPPVNFNAQFNALKQNKAHANQLVLLAPVNKVNTKVVPLVQMGKSAALEQQMLARKQFEAARNRAAIESKLAQTAPPKIGEKVRPITIQTPKFNVNLTQDKIKTIPAPPPGLKNPVIIAGKKTTTNPVVNPPIGTKDKTPPVVIPKDKTPPVVIPKDKTPPVVSPKDKTPPVVIPKDKTPPVVIPKDKTPPVVSPKEKTPPVVIPPKVSPQPPKVNPPVNPPKVNPPVNPAKVNPPVNPPKDKNSDPKKLKKNVSVPSRPLEFDRPSLLRMDATLVIRSLPAAETRG
jgi:hypothetical protein